MYEVNVNGQLKVALNARVIERTGELHYEIFEPLKPGDSIKRGIARNGEWRLVPEEIEPKSKPKQQRARVGRLTSTKSNLR